MPDAVADGAARSVSRASARSDVIFSQASQADVPGPAERNSSLDAEAQQRVAALHRVVPVADQASGLFFVSSAVLPMVGVHDGLVFVAQASSAEDVLGAQSFVTLFEASEADALLVALSLLHGPAAISELLALLCVMCVAVADSAYPHRVSRHPVVTHNNHSNVTKTFSKIANLKLI